jgi:hypothetical protein
LQPEYIITKRYAGRPQPAGVGSLLDIALRPFNKAFSKGGARNTVGKRRVVWWYANLLEYYHFRRIREFTKSDN